MGGEHATSIDGEGRNPTDSHLMAVASKAGLEPRKAKEIMEAVRDAVENIN
jgi:serine/threonine-protein kinase HipA